MRIDELEHWHWRKEKEEGDLVTLMKKEKDLNANDIKKILQKAFSEDYLFTSERNVRGINENPFDFILGEEKTLKLVGLEIKSDKDSFTRLKSQLNAYLYTFHEVYLVLHKKKKPEWLPYNIGVMRVSEKGKVYVENSSIYYDPLDVSTDYEWDALFRNNGLGITSKKTRDTLKIIGDVRRNIIFNRFFAVHDGYNTKKFVKYYPFSEAQKSVVIGFDVPHHYKDVLKEVGVLEKRMEVLRKLCMIGQSGLKDFK